MAQRNHVFFRGRKFLFIDAGVENLASRYGVRGVDRDGCGRSRDNRHIFVQGILRLDPSDIHYDDSDRYRGFEIDARRLMLHLVADEALKQSVVERVSERDDVLLLGGAVWATYSGHSDNAQISRLLQRACCVYVLSDMLAANGIAADKLMQGVRVIDYSAFVDLTVDNTRIHTWC
jgi:tRNA 2-thiouridine synthesizing protein B